MEVGAGLGVLTAALLAKGAKVVALEVDSGFFRVLEDKFADSPNVELVHADALKFNFRALSERIGKLRVVANLPYNISSRLLFMFQEGRAAFSSLHILLQREVAERFVAEPGTKEYGVLTVLLGVNAKVETPVSYSWQGIFPAPEVMSSLVSVRFPEPPPVAVSNPKLLSALVKASFAGRRKTLRNTLKNAAMFGISNEVLIQVANEVGIDLGRRGETLSPAEFARFADAIAGKR